MKSDNYSLQQLLMMAINDSQSNCIAFCLAISRTQAPTQQTIQLNLELINKSNDIRWIQVLQRQAVHNYQLAFSICKDIIFVYPTLFQLNYPQQNQAQFDYLKNNVIYLMTQSNEQQINNQIKWNALAALGKVYLRDQIMNFNSFESFMANLNILLSNPNILTDFQNWKNFQLQSDQSIDNSIYLISAIELVCIIVRLYKKFSNIIRKKMRYLQFTNDYKPIIYWIRNNYQQFLQMSVSLIKAPFQKYCHKTLIKFKLIQDSILCLIELSQFSQMNQFIMTSYSTIIQILFNNYLIVIDNMQQIDIEDELNRQYSLIDGYFGQDLASFITRLILSLSKCPGFLSVYINNLHKAYQTSAISQNQTIMKLSIINKHLSQRKDITHTLVEPFISLFFSNFIQYNDSLQSQMNFSRKLRLFFLFFQFLKQSQIQKLMNHLYLMLRNEKYTSFCFKEACKLMQKLQQIQKHQNNKRNHISSLVKSIKQQSCNIINELFNILYNHYGNQIQSKHSVERQGKLIEIYRLVEKVVNTNESQIEHLFPNFIRKLSNWLSIQFQQHWSRGVQSSQILQLMIRITKKMILNLTQAIYNILSFMKYNQALSYQQQLLQILIFVLDLQKLINSNICQILTYLKKIVQNYNQNIFTIRYVLKALCNQKLAQSIIYQWKNLFIFLLNLFLQYFKINTNTQYTVLYRQQWLEIINIFGLFLQIYDALIDQDQNKYITSVVNDISDQQIKLQLLIVVNFKGNGKIDPLCNASNIITQLKYRKTFKLIIFYYCKILEFQYDQLIVNQLIQCHRIYKEKIIKRDFDQQITYMQWPYLSGKIQKRTLQVIRKTKRQRHIDDFQYNQILKQLNFN